MSADHRKAIPSNSPPSEPARKLGHLQPKLLLDGTHDLCPGCGEPVAIRTLLEVIEELGCETRAIGVVGIGCYTALCTSMMDVDLGAGAARPRPVGGHRCQAHASRTRSSSRCRATATW